MRSLRFGRLFRRFFLLIFLCCTLLIALIEFGNYSHLTDAMDDEVYTANFRALTKVQLTMDSLLENVTSALMSLSIDSDVISYMTVSKSAPPNYSHIVNTQSILRRIGIYSTSNPCASYSIYSALNDSVLSYEMGDVPLKQYTDAGVASVAVGELEFRFTRISTQMAPTWKLTLAIYPAVAAESRYGLIAANMDSDVLARQLVNAKFDDESRVFVLDSDGAVLVDSDGTLTGATEFPLYSDSALLEQDAGGATIQLDGEMQYLSWLKAGKYGLIYAQVVPFESYSLLLNTMWTALGLSLVMGTLISLIISYMLARYAMRPIEAISKLLENEGMAAEPEDVDGDEMRYILMRIMLMSDAAGELANENLMQYRALKQARSTALQAQITPHFLRNVLQSIHIMVLLETGNEKSPAAEALIALSEIARNVMEKGRDTLLLSEEIEMLKKYVFIQKLARGEDLDVEYRAAPTLTHYSVPKLCLQPLVENAIRHNGRHIVVSATDGGEFIDFAVDDDGLGMSEDKLAQYNELFHQDELFRSQHVGLVNLDQRLKLLYGEMTDLTLTPSARGGLRVTFRVPKVVQ